MTEPRIKDRYETIAEDILAKVHDMHPPELRLAPKFAENRSSSPAPSLALHSNIEPNWEWKRH